MPRFTGRQRRSLVLKIWDFKSLSGLESMGFIHSLVCLTICFEDSVLINVITSFCSTCLVVDSRLADLVLLNMLSCG